MATRGRKGQLRKTVTVFSNDPKTPQLQLEINANIEVLLSLEPERIYLSQIYKGSQQTSSLKLVGSLAEKARIVSVESSRPELKATVAEGGKAISLNLQAPAEPGNFQATVTVKTDQDTVPELRTTVAAQVSEDLVVFPVYVNLSPLDPNKPSTAKTVVRSLTHKPFKLLKAEDTNGALSATFTPRGDPLGSEVEVQLKLDSAPKIPRGKLQLFTDRKEQPTLSLQYGVQPRSPQGAGPNLLKPISREPLQPAPFINRKSLELKMKPAEKQEEKPAAPVSKTH